MTRPTSDRDGPCICDYGPNTDGPQEDCPFHGRPYAYWVERGDALTARLARVEALAVEIVGERNIDGADMAAALRAALAAPTPTEVQP
jgi:hypothetical protein